MPWRSTAAFKFSQNFYRKSFVLLLFVSELLQLLNKFFCSSFILDEIPGKKLSNSEQFWTLLKWTKVSRCFFLSQEQSEAILSVHLRVFLTFWKSSKCRRWIFIFWDSRQTRALSNPRVGFVESDHLHTNTPARCSSLSALKHLVDAPLAVICFPPFVSLRDERNQINAKWFEMFVFFSGVLLLFLNIFCLREMLTSRIPFYIYAAPRFYVHTRGSTCADDSYTRSRVM